MKQRLLVFAVFLFIMVSPFVVVYIIQENATTYTLSKSMEFPIPKGSRHINSGLGMDIFQTKKSVDEVRQFYAEYLDSLMAVYEKSETHQKGYYDKDQNLVIMDYSVSDVNGKTVFSIDYDPFDTLYWSLE